MEPVTEMVDEGQIEEVRALLKTHLWVKVSESVRKTPWYFGGGAFYTLTLTGPPEAVERARVELKKWLARDQAERSW